MNLHFEMGAINSIKWLRWHCHILLLKFDWNPEFGTALGYCTRDEKVNVHMPLFSHCKLAV